MRLSKQAVKEFKQAYFEEFGEKISDCEANEKGLELLNLFRTIYKPIPKGERERIYKNTKRNV